jgi:adenylate kinase
MRIVLLGAPGSGKGTQAQRLQAKFGVPQVSSGDLLRDAVARKTELGLKAQAAMETGQLVSDAIVLGLIRERLSQADAANGFILDGFPRNSGQAATLSQLLVDIGQPLEAVLLMEVRTKTLIERLAGRRTCKHCGKVFSISALPADMSCTRNAAGHELYQRADDKEDVIAKRLDVYQSQTKPLIDHYNKLGLLKVIKGEGTLELITTRMETALTKKDAKLDTKPVAESQQPPVKSVAKPVAKPAAKNLVKKAIKKKSSKKKVVAKSKAAPVKADKKQATKKALKKVNKTPSRKVVKAKKKSTKKVTKKAIKKAARKK